MAITTEDGLIAALATAQKINYQKASITSVASTFSSLWDASGLPGAGSLTIGNTTTGVVPTDATSGAPTINAFTGANKGYILGAHFSGNTVGQLYYYDRLFHVGSVVVTSTGTTTLSSQPSISSRVPGADYNGIEMWLEVNAAVSATAVTVSVTYTNQAGTAGQTATLDSNLSGLATRRLLPFRLASGDFGVQKVESIIVGGSAASTGSINIVLARKLCVGSITAANIPDNIQDPFSTKMTEIFTDSCLWGVVFASTTSTGFIESGLTIGNG